MSAGPEVSVCIPAYEAEGWIERAVASALEQTHRELEVVVVDNASSDGTVARVLGIADPRVRLFVNSHNVGVYRNFNRAVALARGRYIKFLCADDVLEPNCVEEMLRPFALSQRVGLCFTPRTIVLEDTADASGGRWKAKHERTHERFGELQELNSGSTLLEPWLADRLADNWIGEPSNVMMSRECLARVGTFPPRMHDKGDMDLWIRAMLDHEVGFVDRPLVRVLVRSDSLGVANRETGRPWLDTVWMFEDILSTDGARRYPKLRALRRRALARTARNALLRRRVPDRGKLAGARAYTAFRLFGRSDRSRLYGGIDDRVPAGETVEVSAAGSPASGGASGLVSAGRSRSGSGSGA
jgi:glycosyltransferase involved in cell wall biosynthesis